MITMDMMMMVIYIQVKTWNILFLEAVIIIIHHIIDSLIQKKQVRNKELLKN